VARQFIKLEDSLSYLSEQYYFDLLTWYHIAWMGETVRRQHKLLNKLVAKQKNFSHDDRLDLLRLIGELVAGVIPAYKKLAETGQVELAFSPYAHPIVPLLLNFQCAKESMPDVNLPQSAYYPGGEERSMWHIQTGLQTFEKYFGRRPRGCWPSEGGVSEASLRLYDQFNIEWIATGENILRKSLPRTDSTQGTAENHCAHRAFRMSDRQVSCFFRDDGLSDLIGFSYSRWHADDAVANLMHHITNIAEACDGSDTVISIVLDGENAWEYYPENGYYFLNALYEKLSQHEAWELTTFSSCLDAGVEPLVLKKLVAGSWVYGTFSTWIGDKEKNRAWDLLCEAKRQFDMAVSQERLKGKQLEQAMQQLAICEGSDWFWWFGDYNPAVSVSEFDRLFRLHLAALYQIIGIAVPPSLTQVISRGGGSPAAGGVMRPGT
jgi:alpha-amylase/alpha-mannosidase (GH57 family)